MLIETIEDHIGLSNSLSRALLLKCGWSKDHVVDLIADEKDLIANVFNFNFEEAILREQDKSNFTCKSCYDEYEQ